jgi:hypothetical protein
MYGRPGGGNSTVCATSAAAPPPFPAFRPPGSQWGPRPAPRPPTYRMVAPGGNPNGCCADVCCDPTQPCLDDCLGGADFGASDVPFDCAFCGVGFSAVVFTAATFVLAFVAVPSLTAAMSVSTLAEAQVALCASTLNSSGSTGCGFSLSRANASSAAIQDQVLMLHAPLIHFALTTLHYGIIGLYASAAVVLWAVVVAGVFTWATQPPAAPSSSPPPFPSAIPQAPAPGRNMAAAPTATVNRLHQMTRHVESQRLRLAECPAFISVSGAWPAIGLFAVVLTAIPAGILLPLLHGALSVLPSGHPAVTMLTTFTIKYAAAAGFAAMTVSLPLCLYLLRALGWLVFGLPWFAYRYAGDRRVPPRALTTHGQPITSVCDVPFCIAMDMLCCPCSADAAAPVDLAVDLADNAKNDVFNPCGKTALDVAGSPDANAPSSAPGLPSLFTLRTVGHLSGGDAFGPNPPTRLSSPANVHDGIPLVTAPPPPPAEPQPSARASWAPDPPQHGSAPLGRKSSSRRSRPATDGLGEAGVGMSRRGDVVRSSSSKRRSASTDVAKPSHSDDLSRVSSTMVSPRESAVEPLQPKKETREEKEKRREARRRKREAKLASSKSGAFTPSASIELPADQSRHVITVQGPKVATADATSANLDTD